MRDASNNTRNDTSHTAASGARVSPEEQAQTQKLESEFGGRWRVFRGVCEWYVVRRCGRPCPRPEVHGSRHIGRAATLDKLAVLLAELDSLDQAQGSGQVR